MANKHFVAIDNYKLFNLNLLAILRTNLGPSLLASAGLFKADEQIYLAITGSKA
jgi:hypothetical protein